MRCRLWVLCLLAHRSGLACNSRLYESQLSKLSRASGLDGGQPNNRELNEPSRRAVVLCSYLGTSHHQADACHLASVYLGFRSIWNTHFCLRLQPHLYPSLIGTSLGRDIRLNSDISQRMSSPTPPSKTRNYC